MNDPAETMQVPSDLMVSVPRYLVFSAACAGDQSARLLLDEMYPIGPCEYCSGGGLKGQTGHFLGCPRSANGEIGGSAISQAKAAFARGEIDVAELERRVVSSLRRSVIAKATGETEDAN